jgi:hypothetical protein
MPEMFDVKLSSNIAAVAGGGMFLDAPLASGIYGTIALQFKAVVLAPNSFYANYTDAAQSYNPNVPLAMARVTFDGNSADGGPGGGLAWVSPISPLGVVREHFSNNNAEYGTDFINIYNKTLVFADTGSTAPLPIVSASGSPLWSVNATTGLISNYRRTIVVWVTDNYLNLFTQDNTTTVVFSKADGELDSTSVSGEVVKKASNGLIDISGLVVTGIPGTIVRINILLPTAEQPSVGSLITASVNQGFQAAYVSQAVSELSPLQLLVTLRNCVQGEVYDMGVQQCRECDPGTYTFYDRSQGYPEEENVCKKCPVGAWCAGGAKVFIMAGYWRPTYDSPGQVLDNSGTYSYTQCPVSTDCLGLPATFPDQQAGSQPDAGYLENAAASINLTATTAFVCTDSVNASATLCYRCAESHARLTSGSSCEHCPSLWVTIVLVLLGLLLLVFLSALLVHTRTGADGGVSLALLGDKDGKLTSFETAILVRIFLQYLQISSRAATFRLGWPTAILQFADSQSTASSQTDNLLGLDCLFMGITNPANRLESLFYYKAIIFDLLPIICILVPAALWFGVFVKKRAWLRRELSLHDQVRPVCSTSF